MSPAAENDTNSIDTRLPYLLFCLSHSLLLILPLNVYPEPVLLCSQILTHQLKNSIFETYFAKAANSSILLNISSENNARLVFFDHKKTL